MPPGLPKEKNQSDQKTTIPQAVPPTFICIKGRTEIKTITNRIVEE